MIDSKRLKAVADYRLAKEVHNKEVSSESNVIKGYVNMHGFIHKLPDFRVHQMIKIFGDPDTIIHTSITTCPESGYKEIKRGRATWLKPRLSREAIDNGIPQLCFIDELVIYDILLHHENPVSHVDFLFTTSETFSSKGKKAFFKVQGMGESITINLRVGMGTVTAGCHFFVANLVSHFVSTKLLNGEIMSLSEAKIQYGTLISDLATEWTKTGGDGREWNMPKHRIIIDYLNGMRHNLVNKVNKDANDLEIADIRTFIKRGDDTTMGETSRRMPRRRIGHSTKKYESSSNGDDDSKSVPTFY